MAIYYSENVKVQKIETHKELITVTYVKTYIAPITIFGITLKEGYFVYKCDDYRCKTIKEIKETYNSRWYRVEEDGDKIIVYKKPYINLWLSNGEVYRDKFFNSDDDMDEFLRSLGTKTMAKFNI